MMKTFIHGDKNLTELFELIGIWIVDESIHAELGAPITSRPDDIWSVSVENGKADGFCQMRRFQNNHMHLRYLYAPTASVRKQLAYHAIKTAKDLGSVLIYINDRTTNTLWKSIGFKEYARKNSSFSKWERDLHEKPGL